MSKVTDKMFEEALSERLKNNPHDVLTVIAGELMSIEGYTKGVFMKDGKIATKLSDLISNPSIVNTDLPEDEAEFLLELAKLSPEERKQKTDDIISHHFDRFDQVFRDLAK